MTGFGDKKSGHKTPESAELYRGSHCYYPPPPSLSTNLPQSSRSANNNNDNNSDYYKSAVPDSMYQHDLRAPYYPPPAAPHHTMAGFQYYGSYGGPSDDGRALLNAPPLPAVASTSTSQPHMVLGGMDRHPIDYYGQSAADISTEQRDSDPDDPAWYYQQPQEHMINMMYMNNRYLIFI